MPTADMIALGVIVAVFGVFAVTLAWVSRAP